MCLPLDYTCYIEWHLTKKPLKLLDPFPDINTRLRVGGRLRRAPFDYNDNHSRILPKYGHLTQLIIKHYHEKAQHQGRGITISTIRSNGFYIIEVSRLVASMIFKWVRCRKLRHACTTQVQEMSDLPSDCIKPSAPFTFVSLDCFEPLGLLEGIQSKLEHCRHGRQTGGGGWGGLNPP